MTQAPERRDTRRVVVGPDHTIRFIVKGHPFREVRITNLSTGGCFAVVGSREAALFGQGTLLEQLVLEHPSMPQATLTAQVRYSLGAQAEQPLLEFLGLGLMFVAVPPEVSAFLQGFVDAHLGPMGSDA